MTSAKGEPMDVSHIVAEQRRQAERRRGQRRTPAERAQYDLDVAKARHQRAREAKDQAGEQLVQAQRAKEAADAGFVLATAELEHARKAPALRQQATS